MKLFAKSFHLRSDHTEVLSNKWQIFQFSLQRSEKLRTRPLYPPTSRRRLGPGGDLPVSVETAKMIQSHKVEQLERCSDALNPPSVTRTSRFIPPIKRVSPELTRCAEIVRWNA